MYAYRAVLLFLTLAGCGATAAAPDGGAEADASAAVPPLEDAGAVGDADAGTGCPPEMARIAGFCMDRYEAHVVEVVDGGERAHSPYVPVDGLAVRARAARGVVPQGYISQVQAAQACRAAGKRLCSAAEFALGCRGADATNSYPYGGQVRVPGACNEGKGSSVPLFHGSDPAKWTYADFNDPRLNQWDGGLAPTGAYSRCASPAGLYDCVGNLHEWGDDPPDARGHGRFRGGFYGDAEVNGHGCRYVTSAHEPTYHDYSTGFRCCSDAR